MATILAGAQVSPSGDAGPVGGGTAPIGAILDYAGATEPPGWLFCFGQAVNRVGIYAELYAAIGVVWGAGNGTSTFNVPDLRGLVLAGKDNMGGTAADRLTTAWGVDGVTLGANGGSEKHQLTTPQIPSHQHGGATSIGGQVLMAGSNYVVLAGGQQSGAAGGGQSHPNVQPTAVCNKIIKYASVSLGPLIPGTGDVVGPAGAVDGDVALFNGNTGKLIRAQSLASAIALVRNRSYNAIGNPNFEVNQRRYDSVYANIPNGVFCADRWYVGKVGTAQCSAQQIVQDARQPGSSFRITQNCQRFTLTTAQASLGVNDYWSINQNLEGIQLRELVDDVTSISLLVRSSVADLKFCVGFNDYNGTTITRSIAYLCTLGAANTFTLVTIPNIPLLAAGGNWSAAPQTYGYSLCIALAAGTNYISSTPGAWFNGQRIGVAGMDNFVSKPVGSTFDLAFVQHEPGPECTSLIDLPFDQNLWACLRYYDKSYRYDQIPVLVTGATGIVWPTFNALQPYGVCQWKRELAGGPNLTIWSTKSGNGNTVHDLNANADRATTGEGGTNHVGFSTLALSAYPAANWLCSFHYTAATNF